jgi:hypothetical protein
MPTYSLRTGANPAMEHGVYIDANSGAVETLKILTETVLTFSDSAGYTVGETVTEDTSTETGIVLWNDTGTDQVGLIAVSDAFTGDLAVVGGTSGTNKTPTACMNILEKTAETPRYAPLIASTTLTSEGTEDDQTLYLNNAAQWLRIQAVGADVTVSGYSTSYRIATILSGKTAYVCTNHQINPIVAHFSAAGSAIVEEYTGNPTTLVVEL